MAQKTRAQLDALIAANLPDNVSKLITPIKHREVEEDLTDSSVNVLDDLITSSAGVSSAGKVPVTNGSGQLDASFIPGGGGSAAWGAITGTLSNQTDLANALALKAALASPHFTGNPQFDILTLYLKQTGFGDIGFIDETGWFFYVPLVEPPTAITDSDSTTVLVTDRVIDYERTDAADLLLPLPGSVNGGQHLRISNRSSSSFNLTAPSPNSFFNGSLGVVSTITVAPNQTISLQALVSEWQVVSSYLSETPSSTVALVDAATVTPDSDTTSLGVLTSLSQTTAFDNPTGSPSDGQELTIRVKSASAQTISFDTEYRGGNDLALPSTTTGGGLTDYWKFKRNADDSTWDLVGKVTGY